MLHKVNRVLYPVSLLGSSLLLAACGGGSTSDTTAPGISSTNPADSATAVARSGSLTATFNEDIFAVTVDAASFTLAQPGAGNTPGSVVFDGVTNVASFTPDSRLAFLTDYTATLNTAITDLSGNALAADYNWSFTTADGTWGSGALFETDDAGHAFAPQIAFDSNGNALAVWTQSDGTRYNIWANRFDGTNWSSAELIETDDAGNALNPQIAFDSNGNALAVWWQHDGARNNIWANRFNGAIWGSAELIEADAGTATNPQIAIDSNGNALAVWVQHDGTRNNIWANRFDGISWGSAELIEADDAGHAYSPQIAFDNNGNALAVWHQNDGTRYNIWANRFDGSIWGSAELIEADDAGRAGEPQIAIDSNGNALAVWDQFDGTRYNIWANRFDGSIWGSAELIETDDAGGATNPQIAIDSNGNALAAWGQSDGTRDNLWVNRFNGSSWGSAVLLETDSAAGDASYPLITFDNNGNALMGWQQDDGTRNSSWARRFDGTNWGAPVLIETDAFDAYTPQIAIDNNGNALALWEQFDGTRQNIWVRRFE